MHTKEQPQIEKGIEITRRRQNEEMWQLAEKIQPGESVLYDREKEARSLRNKIRKLGGKSTMRPEGEGFRVWKK